MALDDRTLDAIVSFHGHMCPGLAIGIKAAEVALKEIGPHSRDEEVVAVVETDMCAVDAIQFLTGCTFGKGNLIHRDWGKNAFTFYRRSDSRALRIVTRPDAWGDDAEDEQRRALFGKIRAGRASEAEERRFRELHEARSRRILDAPTERLFEMQEVRGEPPPRARIHDSVPCSACGEAVMETRVRRFGGQELCIPCFERETAAS